MNNVGMINIGSLLTRLGLQIFSNPTNQQTPIVITSGTSENIGRTGDISRSFFRELGAKVLKLIDVLIAKMESKSQKYK